MRASLLALFFLAAALHAADFAPIFSNGAVLQRDQPIAVWGSGRDGEAVTVEIFGKTAATTVANGKWLVTLPAMPAAENGTLVLKGDNEIRLSDIAVGEVWICSGQSNMEWRLNACASHYDSIVLAANDPGIREFKVPLRAYSGEPIPPQVWRRFVVGPATQFGAIGYFFAAELRKKLGVVVGLVNCAFGGTSIESWMDRETLLATGGAKLLEEDAAKMALFATPADYEKAWNDYTAAKKDWEAKKKSGVPAAELGPQPKEPYGYRSKSRPTGLHDSMLGVIRPYTARGFLWYQGETNGGNLAYEKMLSGFISAIRKEWKSPEMPFLIAQLSSPSATNPDEGDAFAIIREAQRKVAMETLGAGLVVTLDYGEKGNVHPTVKQPIGERFARLALGRVYGDKEFAPQSPVATEATLRNGAVWIQFADVPKSLEIRDAAIPSLEVQNETGAWVPVKAELGPDLKSLRILQATPQSTPKSVRYAWKNFCTLSLYSDEGLPVSPWFLEVKK
jgi:sialate O-acetylesterase